MKTRTKRIIGSMLLLALLLAGAFVYAMWYTDIPVTHQQVREDLQGIIAVCPEGSPSRAIYTEAYETILKNRRIYKFDLSEDRIELLITIPIHLEPFGDMKVYLCYDSTGEKSRPYMLYDYGNEFVSD